MTDRHAGYLVVLEHDVREDDAQGIITAIQQLRGVVSVGPIVGNVELHIAQERVRHELGMQLLDVVFPHRKNRREANE